MNKVILSGRPTRDPLITQTAEHKIAKFSLAVDRKGKDKSADFPSCVGFGKTAEFIEKYIHQGTKIIIEGHIQTGSYTKQSGEKVYTTDVILENVEFAESKKAESSFTPVADNFEDDDFPFK